MNFDFKTCMLTKNDCYKKHQAIVPKGIIVHSTGANNPYLRRYVQPDDGILGVNPNNNSWNRSGIDKCVHAMIGKDKNGLVRCYQTLPWDIACWGIGRGSKGSYNYNPAYIQFEMCEDSLTDKNYFEAVMECATSLCAYLCEKFNLDISNVISHHEGYLRGYGSDHADCDHWLKKFGKDMNWFRSQVKSKLTKVDEPTKNITSVIKHEVVRGDSLSKLAKKYDTTVADIMVANPFIKDANVISKGWILNIPTTAELKIGDEVKLKAGATYYNGKTIPSWVVGRKLYYRGDNKNGAVVSILKIGAITGTVKKSDLIKV